MIKGGDRKMATAFSNADRAEVLTQALPYFKKYYGKTVVVKYGGNAMLTEDLQQQVMEDIVLLNLVGVKVVLVHGGGPEISENHRHAEARRQGIAVRERSPRDG